jgi:hypothetical protein
LLPRTKRWPELLRSLDALASWEDEFEARERAALEAGRVAFEELGDADGAWRRLEPLVVEGNDEAEKLLRNAALGAERGVRLAGLYVRLAQEAEDKALCASYWQRASRVYEDQLEEPSQAL